MHRVLTRHGQARLPRPRRRPAKRYEKSRPGELLHVDIKLLPALRNARYDYEFAAVDDFSREAVVTIATDQTSAHRDGISGARRRDLALSRRGGPD